MFKFNFDIRGSILLHFFFLSLGCYNKVISRLKTIYVLSHKASLLAKNILFVNLIKSLIFPCVLISCWSKLPSFQQQEGCVLSSSISTPPPSNPSAAKHKPFSCNTWIFLTKTSILQINISLEFEVTKFSSNFL
jgi:hypothetical protein